ncbi:hypothetical protein QJS10_CPA16g01450 [Acorus calamus]|uniref:Transketolase-like pyrimidine-binding domain-containing protein n=1 Tax=Acorus calamus TaxID=4465 RepID=A0AAV9CZJ3_ACOCL|nr:hypothetical protein QJS10_CPA16g01450 [Acorus calamus]
MELEQLAEELRSDVIFNVSKTGGHLGSSLGVVELTVAIHHVFNTPQDKILWDVGHQGVTKRIGGSMHGLAAKVDEYARGMISGSGSTLFEELGLYYIGPVDGHSVDDLITILKEVIHDVDLQKLPVRFALDRAGLVGADGPTHSGSFDVTFMACLPNMVVMAPSDEEEFTWSLLRRPLMTDHPVSGIRGETESESLFHQAKKASL